MDICIITMYCGENEFSECVGSVKLQNTLYKVKQLFIKNKGNAEAHNLLYSMIMDKSNKYDYFVKLDADMVFEHDNSLDMLIKLAVDSKADIFSIPVNDFMTGTMLWGLNVYKSGVEWHINSNELFTDQQVLKKQYKQAKQSLNLEQSLVSHASNPTDMQAYMFGVHRAAKVTQTEESTYLIGHAIGQLNTLKNVFKKFKSTKNKKHGFALIGAYQMLNGLNKSKGFLSKASFEEDFSLLNYEQDIIKAIEFFSKNKLIILFKSVGMDKLLKGLFYYLKRKVL